MSRLFFSVMYRLGFMPWDGHALPARLRDAATRPDKGRALDIGCGTGDASVFLAAAGWDVTGVDFVERALDRARSKARAAGVDARFVRADVTALAAALAAARIDRGFQLLLDSGCLHGLAEGDREACAGHLTALAAPGATLVIAAFERGARRRPAGMSLEDVERLFGAAWTLEGHEREAAVSNDPAAPIHVYELRRRPHAQSSATPNGQAP